VNTTAPDTDPTNTPHWQLTTAQATEHFNREHANEPIETWQPADFDAYQNLHLAT
jgi:hypothetical protein